MAADRYSGQRQAFRRSAQKIMATQDVCGICGKPVDKNLRPPDPMAPTIDHVVPISRGGHPSDLDNLQLAHWICNRQKSDKLMKSSKGSRLEDVMISNRNLPQSVDWGNFSPEK